MAIERDSSGTDATKREAPEGRDEVARLSDDDLARYHLDAETAEDVLNELAAFDPSVARSELVEKLRRLDAAEAEALRERASKRKAERASAPGGLAKPGESAPAEAATIAVEDAAIPRPSIARRGTAALPQGLRRTPTWWKIVAVLAVFVPVIVTILFMRGDGGRTRASAAPDRSTAAEASTAPVVGAGTAPASTSAGSTPPADSSAPAATASAAPEPRPAGTALPPGKKKSRGRADAGAEEPAVGSDFVQ